MLDVAAARLAFICNPNNPTGSIVPPEVIGAWARQHPEIMFVVDESYLFFAADSCSVRPFDGRNLLVLRSMTKDFALAGLRLGYAIGHGEIIAALRQAQPPWSVSAVAQAGGVAALHSPEHVQQSLAALRAAKSRLVAGLHDFGLHAYPSAVHFFLIKVGNGATFRQALLPRGMLVRDCASFGLSGFVRMAARRPEENERLLVAIREVTSRCD
jgi:histidinol-phosphate/aromatic aminotransferase/cobyric acid decarboxylase-like protein